MCYGGGNCDGGCESKYLHDHNCVVCGELLECVGTDCGDALCDRHSGYKPCPWCGEWHEQTRWHGYCSMTCLEESNAKTSEDLDAADMAAMDVDAANEGKS